MRQALGPGALGKPRGSRWRGRWEGGSGWEKKKKKEKKINGQIVKKKKKRRGGKNTQKNCTKRSS